MHACRFAFREWFGLRPAEADLLTGLYEAEGEVVSRAQLAATARVVLPSVPVLVVRLRGALEPEAIDCARGQGYRLTDQGLAECRRALRSLSEELQAVS
jgi:DNA-binding response OmpR family regulator